MPVLGRNGVPSSGVSAVLVTVGVLSPRTAGWLAVYPAGLARPIARSLTYDAGVGVRTTVLAKVGTGGAIKIYVPAGQAAVIVDVAGYVTS